MFSSTKFSLKNLLWTCQKYSFDKLAAKSLPENKQSSAQTRKISKTKDSGKSLGNSPP